MKKINLKIFATISAGLALIFLYLIDISFFNILFKSDNIALFFVTVASSVILMSSVYWAEDGKDIFIREIPGIKAMEEAVGRATEMGKPVLFVPGILDFNEVETIAGINVLGHVSKLTAEYETELNVPVSKSIVMEAAREICKDSYLQAGRPDLYNNDMVYFLADSQFAYAAGINGYMLREKPAACFYQGKFYAESLLLAETGNSIGAIQIAGTGSSSQIPFFVTACDYTLIGEEFLTASAILSDKPDLKGSIRGQDIIKLLVIIAMAIVALLPLASFLVGAS
ncbi:MAG: hypothetical protein CMG13_00860 [Candidatus Marinimicrobia bacterium]|nr:hypothetical protein [Candidatus Neomarinimicrobiota bacterium]